jgi:hypothetical protein
VPPDAVSVTDAPTQIEVADAVTLIVGNAFTVIVFEKLSEQPAVFVPVTE